MTKAAAAAGNAMLPAAVSYPLDHDFIGRLGGVSQRKASRAYT
jgi:hypothetical protein